MVRAIAHPLRLEILRALGERASPTELSRKLGEPLGTVSYHVRVLADLGLLRLVEQAPRRGAIEHYYEVAPGVVADMLRPSLDEKGREDLTKALTAFRTRVSKIERDAAARGDDGEPALVMLLGFPGITQEAA